MKIALVSQEYPPETARGGIGTQTYLRAHALSELGHEIHVVSRSTDDATHTYSDGPVQVTRIPGYENRLPIYTETAQWLTYSAEVASALAALHANHHLNLIVVPEWGGEGFIHLVNRTEWNHIPTVVHIHGPMVMLANTIGWPEMDSEFYRVGTMMEGASLRLADAISSSSDCSADWCARHYGLKRDEIQTLHCGVDTRLFRPLDVPKSDRPTIIAVGSIAGNKGARLLVDAACKLAREFPGLRLQMLGRGDGRLLEELRAKANAAGLPELLDLRGFVDRQELPQYLSRAHVFALPSTYEGGPGNVYLEAMACGLPVIACAGSGAAEAITSEDYGFLIPPKDLEALVALLRRLLSSAELREAIGARGRRFVLEEADIEVRMTRLEAFYRSVAGVQPPLVNVACS